MRLQLDNLPEPVAKRFREFYRRKRLYELLRVVLSAAAVYLLLALVVIHLDRFLFLERSTRTVLSGIVHAAGVIYTIVLLVFFGVRRASLRRVAYELESRMSPDVSERYVTLADMSGGGRTEAESKVHAALMAQLEKETATHSVSFIGSKLVLDRRFRVLGWITAAVLAVYFLMLAAPGYQFPLMLQRFFTPGANLPKPSFVRVEITPESPVAGKGGEVVLQARTRGEVPRGLRWLFDLMGASQSRCLITLSSVGGEKPAEDGEVHTMNRIQRTLFVFSRTDLQESFRFSVRCADAQTAIYLAEVVAQPRITGISLRITPPAYTSLPERTVTNAAGAVRVYPGSKVETRFTVDQDVPTRQIIVNDKKEERPEWYREEREGRYSFEFRQDVEFEIKVVNDRGFANIEPARFALRARQDQEPAVRLDYPSGDFSSVPGELVPVQFRVEDDLGIESVFIQYVLNPELDDTASFREIPVEIPEGEVKKARLSSTLDLGAAAAVPGDNILMIVRARDSAGNDGESRPVNIHVTAFARGENERRRLIVLEFLRESFARAAAAVQSGPGGGVAIEGGVYEEILKQAGNMSISLDENASMTSLLELMEREHHFTDLPRHKEDMRMLAGLARYSAAGESPESIRKRLAAVAGVIPSLTVFRQARNLTWRLFGLGYEIESIGKRMDELTADRERVERERRSIVSRFLRETVSAARKDEKLKQLGKEVLELKEQQSDVREKLDSIRRKPSPDGLPDALRGTGLMGPEAIDEEEQPEPSDKEIKLNREVVQLENRIREATREITEGVEKIARSSAPEERQGLRLLDVNSLVRFAVRSSVEAVAGDNPDTAVRRLTGRYLQSVKSRKGTREEAMDRRTALYLESVQDVGDALIELADRGARFDGERIRELQGNLVSSVYVVARASESLGKRRHGLEKVRENLDVILKEVVPELPDLAPVETQARKRLVSAYNGVLESAARAKMENSGKWLRSDMELAGRNPFACFGYYALRLRILSDLRAVNRDRVTDISAVPGAEEERRAMRMLAFEWELADVLEVERISDREKALAAALIALEAVQYLDFSNSSALEECRKRVRQYDSAGPTRLPAGSLGSLCDLERSGRSLEEAESMIAGAWRRDISLPGTVERLKSLAEKIEATVAKFRSAKRALTEQSGDYVRSLRSVLSQVRRDAEEAGEIADILGIELAYLRSGEKQEERERMFLALRERIGRYRVQRGRPLARLENMAGGQMSASDLQTAGMEIDVLSRNHNNLRQGLVRLVEDFESGALAQAQEKYPLLREFDDTRRLIGITEELAGSDNPGEVADRFLEAFPEAVVQFIAARMPLLISARDNLAECSTILDARRPDVKKYGETLKKAETALESFRKTVGLSGDGELQQKLTASTREILNRISDLGAGIEGDRMDIRRRQFLVVETTKQAEELIRILDSASAIRRLSGKLRFQGGPDDIWTRDNRTSALYSARRLGRQVSHARHSAVMGVLSALENRPRPEKFESAFGWSLFEYRVVRSPLTGPVVTISVSGERDGEVKNPLRLWLIQQLNEARKEAAREDTLKHYEEVTLEWVDSMKDFLRY
ncbi:MAG: hypothetical protein R6V03_11310 [Kiritimatiellia bacterium]